jgi:hypothetical protein
MSICFEVCSTCVQSGPPRAFSAHKARYSSSLLSILRHIVPMAGALSVNGRQLPASVAVLSSGNRRDYCFMTSLDRARRYLSNKTTAIAIVAVPLASVAIPPSATAGSLTLSSFNCIQSTSGGGGTTVSDCNATQLPAGTNDVLGVKMFGSGTVTDPFSGYSDLLFTTQGDASGTFAGDVPVSYDFTITNSDPDTVLSWDVYFAAFTTSAGTQSGDANGTTTGGEITGSFNVPLNGTFDGFVLHLDVNENAAPGDSFTVDIPDNSIDVNNAAEVATPEPRLGLFAAALLGSFGWARHRLRGRSR